MHDASSLGNYLLYFIKHTENNVIHEFVKAIIISVNWTINWQVFYLGKIVGAKFYKLGNVCRY